MKKFIADPKINFYIIDSVKIGIETGMGPTRINTIFNLHFSNYRNNIWKKAIEFMKDTAKKTYSWKGEDVVKKNCDAIDAGANGVIKVNVPAEWKKIKLTDKKSQFAKGDKETVKFVNLIQKAINSRQGDNLPVSAFMIIQMVLLHLVLLHMKKEVLLLKFLYGMLIIVLNVIFVLWYVHMQLLDQ